MEVWWVWVTVASSSMAPSAGEQDTCTCQSPTDVTGQSDVQHLELQAPAVKGQRKSQELCGTVALGSVLLRECIHSSRSRFLENLVL